MSDKLKAYGHSFSDERALHAYKKMKAEARKRAIDRKKGISSDEKERAFIRKHFASESKHFKV